MNALFSSEYCCSLGSTAEKNDELTISEALRDPLIATVRRAYGVSPEEFKRLLETAARELEANPAKSVNGGGKKRTTRMPSPSRQREDRQDVCRNDAENR